MRDACRDSFPCTAMHRELWSRTKGGPFQVKVTTRVRYTTNEAESVSQEGSETGSRAAESANMFMHNFDMHRRLVPGRQRSYRVSSKRRCTEVHVSHCAPILSQNYKQVVHTERRTNTEETLRLSRRRTFSSLHLQHRTGEAARIRCRSTQQSVVIIASVALPRFRVRDSHSTSSAVPRLVVPLALHREV